jgi:hypothetical protein
MKWLMLAVFVLLISMLIESCTKRPFACFRTNVNEDSVHINQPVFLNASCSSNTNDYFWEFYNNTDSVEWTEEVTKTFKDTGYVNVYLLVVSGNKSASTSRVLHIIP